MVVCGKCPPAIICALCVRNACAGTKNDYSRGELTNYALTEQNPNLRGQLYNLEEDPGETMNLYEVERERRESMERLLGELTAPVASAKGQDAGEPNTKTGRTAPLGRKPMK
jgi:hypothetical protein